MGGRRGRLISTQNRHMAIKLIQEAKEAGAREEKACQELGISLRTLQRWRQEGAPVEDQRPHAKRPYPANKLTHEEVQEILEVTNQEEFRSLPPSQIVPALADRNIYLASESTIYRILKYHNLQHHRGRSQKPTNRPLSTHCATAPNQVWMWDITWLPGPVRGLYLYLYVIIDLFSRKIVGWEIWPEESAEHASELVRQTVMRENTTLRNRPLILHSDNGSPMKGSTLLETLYQLGITPSRSRPRVSNDNPYAESVFRTCKYRPGYPENGFKDIFEARRWVLHFVHWYNTQHHHSGLNFLTPHQRHTGMDKAIFARRNAVYEAAKAKHPNRWTGKTRDWSLPAEVWLNPEKPLAREILPNENMNEYDDQIPLSIEQDSRQLS